MRCSAISAEEVTSTKKGVDPVGDQLASNQPYVHNQPDKEVAQRSELYLLRRAHGIYFNLVPLLRLRSMEALYLAGEGNSRIDVNVM